MGDITDLLDENNIDYTTQGRDYVIHCLNPEHDDSKPSLRVDKFSGIFGCFSCGFSGDIFEHFGIRNIKYLDVKVERLKDKITKLMWSTPLNIPLDAVAFKDEYRSIKSSTFEHFNCFTTESIEDMQGRLVIPITDIQDNIVNFNGRYLYSDIDPRYKFYPSNSSPPLFPSKPEQIQHSIILVEGIFDMLNLWDKGLKNAVCVFGTSFGSVRKKEKRNANIERLLQYRYQGVDTIYILFDGDLAGEKSAEGLYSYIKDKFNTEVIKLEDGVDPGSLGTIEVKRLKDKLYA